MAAKKKATTAVKSTAPKKGSKEPPSSLAKYDDSVEALLAQAAQDDMRDTADLQKDAGMARLNLKNAPSEFDCVILSQTRANAYWKEAFSPGENVAPDCFSDDGIVGDGTRELPSGEVETGRQACDTCGLNQFGSRDGSRGKLCRNMRILYVQRLEFESANPELLVIPPTGLKNVSNYLRRLIAEGKPRIGVVTRVEKLEDERSPLGNFVFDDAGPVPPEKMKLVAQLYKGAQQARLRAAHVSGEDMGTPAVTANELGGY